VAARQQYERYEAGARGRRHFRLYFDNDTALTGSHLEKYVIIIAAMSADRRSFCISGKTVDEWIVA